MKLVREYATLYSHFNYSNESKNNSDAVESENESNDDAVESEVYELYKSKRISYII